MVQFGAIDTLALERRTRKKLIKKRRERERERERTVLTLNNNSASPGGRW